MILQKCTNPLSCFPNKREGKSSQPNVLLVDLGLFDSVAQSEEPPQVHHGILMGSFFELVAFNHLEEPMFEVKFQPLSQSQQWYVVGFSHLGSEIVHRCLHEIVYRNFNYCSYSCSNTINTRKKDLMQVEKNKINKILVVILNKNQIENK